MTTMRQARHKRGQDIWAMHAVSVMALKELLMANGQDELAELMNAVIDLCLEAIDGDYARRTTQRDGQKLTGEAEKAALVEAVSDSGGQQRDDGLGDQLRLNVGDGPGDEDGLDSGESAGGDDSLATDQDASG